MDRAHCFLEADEARRAFVGHHLYSGAALWDSPGRTTTALLGWFAGWPLPMAKRMPSQAAMQPCYDVLLHRVTGTARYVTQATEFEIHGANSRLQVAGSPCRYVAARFLGNHAPNHSRCT